MYFVLYVFRLVAIVRNIVKMLQCVERNAMAKEKIRETGNIFNYDMNNTNITLFACELHWRNSSCDQ